MSDGPQNQPTDPPPSAGGDSEPVPKLPRGRGVKLSFSEILRVAMLATMLVAVLVLRKPCSENMGRFIESFEPPVDAGARAPASPLPPGEYIRLRGEMTEEELREKLELLEQGDAGTGAGAAGAGAPEHGAGQGAGPAPGDETGASPR